MKALFIDKHTGIIQWSAGLAAGFQESGWETRFFALNRGSLLWRLQHKLGLAAALDRQASALRLAIDLWQPQLVIFFYPLQISPRLVQTARDAQTKPLVIGMAGDRFGPERAPAASLFDRLFYSDSGFLDLAARYGFPANGVFLPHAADIQIFRPGPWPRTPRMVFVANVTAERQAIIDGLACPVDVYGRHWRHGGAHQRIHARRIPLSLTAALYARHQAVLNVRHERNIAQGLNQRSFEALACGTPVLNDNLADVGRCFEPGREILVWKSRDELNALCEQVLADETFARRIGDAGRQRVLAEHTYAHRARQMLADLDLALKADRCRPAPRDSRS